jgi:hypothetical protein
MCGFKERLGFCVINGFKKSSRSEEVILNHNTWVAVDLGITLVDDGLKKGLDYRDVLRIEMI